MLAGPANCLRPYTYGRDLLLRAAGRLFTLLPNVFGQMTHNPGCSYASGSTSRTSTGLSITLFDDEAEFVAAARRELALLNTY
jgi:hypothetical protein